MVLSGLFSKPVKEPGSDSGSDDDEILPKPNPPSQSQQKAARRGRVEIVHLRNYNRGFVARRARLYPFRVSVRTY